MIRPKPLIFLIALNNVCASACEHCLYSCTPEGGWMTEELLDKVARQSANCGCNDIHITGGEPFYDINKLESALNILLKYFKPQQISVSTSGFFATSRDKTIEYLRLLGKKHISRINLSIDRFHLKTIPWKNIINVLEESKRLNLKVVLRPVVDIYSEKLIDPMINLIKEYKSYLVFASTNPLGRAENLDFEIIKMRFNAQKEFISRLKQSGLDNLICAYGGPYITIFPNGTVCRCCFAIKLSYMGNAYDEDLSMIIKKFDNTFIGGLIPVGRRSNCVELKNLLQSDIKKIDQCDLCKNQPFTEDLPPRSKGEPCVKLAGRCYVKITIKDDFDKLFNKILNKKEDFLISFSLTEQDLNRKTGRIVSAFLEKLRSNSVKYKLSKPLPRCLFGTDYIQVVKRFNMPRNCFECNELFTFYNNHFVFCDGTKVPKQANAVTRHAIFMKSPLSSKTNQITRCKNCLYLKRRVCEGVPLCCSITSPHG